MEIGREEIYSKQTNKENRTNKHKKREENKKEKDVRTFLNNEGTARERGQVQMLREGGEGHR